MTSKAVVSSEGRVHSTDIILTDGHMDKINNFAIQLSQSNMVPDHFKGNNLDLAIVVSKAISLGLDPTAMVHEVFPVKNKMTYGSKLIIGMIHNSKLVEPRTYVQEVGDWSKLQLRKKSKFHGASEEGLGVRVGFKYIGDTQPTYGSVLMLEPQASRNSPLWETDPMQQLVYLAAKRWSSVHMPAVTMGMMLADEIEDKSEAPEERDITPSMNGSEESVFNPMDVLGDNQEAVETPVVEEAEVFEAELVEEPKVEPDEAQEVEEAIIETVIEEVASEEESAKEELTFSNAKFVRAITEFAIDNIGTDQPLKVVSYNAKDETINLDVGDRVISYPIVYEGVTMFEAVDISNNPFA